MSFSKPKENERGFQVITFTDRNGQPCSLQQSSLVEFDAPGSSAIWLGCDENAKPHMGHELSPRMHLSVDQVSELVIYLQEWLNTGRFQ